MKIKIAGLWILCSFFFLYSAMAQDTWASWSHSISTKGYEGLRFRLQAQVKTAIMDDSASARLWARVDKKIGTGFFENMMASPIRNNQWKTYSIEGSIDSGATQLAFGALLEANGKFYYDNFKVEIEKGSNKWVTVYSDDFEKRTGNFKPGVSRGTTKSGQNTLYKAMVQQANASNGKVLLISSEKVPTWGVSKTAGKFAAVNGIKLYYEIYGEGPPLVVLHGNGGSISNAGSHYPELVKKYKVIAIDSRAQGRSGDTDSR